MASPPWTRGKEKSKNRGWESHRNQMLLSLLRFGLGVYKTKPVPFEPCKMEEALSESPNILDRTGLTWIWKAESPLPIPRYFPPLSLNFSLQFPPAILSIRYLFSFLFISSKLSQFHMVSENKCKRLRNYPKERSKNFLKHKDVHYSFFLCLCVQYSFLMRQS